VTLYAGNCVRLEESRFSQKAQKARPHAKGKKMKGRTIPLPEGQKIKTRPLGCFPKKRRNGRKKKEELGFMRGSRENGKGVKERYEK